jgi:septal ring factor EnvC (AmiA/AmiB activator)
MTARDPRHCEEHETRISALEKRADDHTADIRKVNEAIADGRVGFAELKKDIQAATTAITDLTHEVKASNASRPSTMDKVKDAAIHWCVPALIVGALWVFSKTGIIPGGKP